MVLNSLFRDEAALWNAFRQGDAAAFEQIYRTHSAVLISYGKRLCPDHDRVRDAVQDVFVEIHQRRATLRDLDSIEVMDGDAYDLYANFAHTAYDKRKAVTFITSYTFNGITTNLTISDPNPTKGIYFQKVRDKTAKTNGGEGNGVPILRYADVLLLFAEAQNEAGNGLNSDAYAALNKVLNS